MADWMESDAISVSVALDDAAIGERSQFGGDLGANVAAHVASANQIMRIQCSNTVDYE